MRKVLVDLELLPCPFCGQQDAFVEQLDSDASVVICQGMVDEHSACLARGPVGVQQSEMEDQPGRDAAIAEWSRRAQPAEAEAVDVRKIVVDSLVGMIAGVTRLIPPTDQPLPDFIQAPVDRAVERISAALAAVTAERDRLREQVAALQSGANSWQSGYDKGREDGAKSAGGWKDQHARDSAELRRLCAERDQLRQHKNDYMDAAEGTRKALLAEVEAFRPDAERITFIEAHWFYSPQGAGWSFGYNEDWEKPGATLRDAIDAAMAAKEG